MLLQPISISIVIGLRCLLSYMYAHSNMSLDIAMFLSGIPQFPVSLWNESICILYNLVLHMYYIYVSDTTASVPFSFPPSLYDCFTLVM